jgi:hypothetical protein
MRAIAAAAAAAALAATLSGCLSPREMEAARLLGDVVDGPAVPPGGRTPERRTVGIPVPEGTVPADLYAVPGRAAAGLVAVPGLTPEGKDDRRAVDLAEAMARAGFEVLVPEPTGRRSLEAGTRDVPQIEAAVRWLSERRGGEPVAVVAPSYAAGPALLAAAREGTAERVAVVVTVGGYRDMEAMLAYLTTGRYRTGPDAPWRTGAPSGVAPWVLVRGNLRLVEDRADRWFLAAIADRRARDPSAPIADLTPDLGPEGRAVLALMENRDPDRVPALVAALPQAVRDELRALDLARTGLGGLRAELVVVHGQDDPVVPWTEAPALAAAAGALAGDGAHVVEGLGHTGPAAPGRGDRAELIRAAVRLLDARDRIAAGTR